jgi:signal recognition particle receptor subunit beta
MTQSQKNTRTTFIQSKSIEGIKIANRQKTLKGNKRLLVRYKRFRTIDMDKGKSTRYWDSLIKKLTKTISDSEKF